MFFFFACLVLSFLFLMLSLPFLCLFLSSAASSLSSNSKATRASPHGNLNLPLLKNKLNGNFGGGSNSSGLDYVDPEQSGKMAVLYRMMQAMKATKNGERIVIVSNYTSTLDLIESMCKQCNWNVLRLDGTITSTKRTKLVDDFNNPFSNAFAFLLSSKAGGCGKSAASLFLSLLFFLLFCSLPTLILQESI
jgi:SNF2 family DNA or RNA helicase